MPPGADAGDVRLLPALSCAVLHCMQTATDSRQGASFPDLADALRQTWFTATQRLADAQQALAAAERAAGEATAHADEVRRQIEVACPPLGIDPTSILHEQPPEQPQRRPASASPSGDTPRQYKDRLVDLLADGRLVAGEQLRTVHHGVEHFARVERDGFISGAGIGSKPTPTAAARAIVGGERNGWKFWTVQRSGRWIPIADLRNG